VVLPEGDLRAVDSVETHVDDVFTRFAERQRRVVARWRLLRAGVPPDVIDRRLRSGSLRPLHRGVYAVGHGALPHLGRETAALLACGRASVLSPIGAAASGTSCPATAAPCT